MTGKGEDLLMFKTHSPYHSLISLRSGSPYIRGPLEPTRFNVGFLYTFTDTPTSKEEGRNLVDGQVLEGSGLYFKRVPPTRIHRVKDLLPEPFEVKIS